MYATGLKNFQLIMMTNTHSPIIVLPSKKNKRGQIAVCQKVKCGKEILTIHHENLGKELYNLRKALDEEFHLEITRV